MSDSALTIPLIDAPVYEPLAEPVTVAIIGAGNRTSTVYLPLLKWLAPWIRVVAICDPVREHADRFAEQTGARPFYHIRDLVAAKPMQAAVVVVPIEAHHAISVFLSRHGIHHLIETQWTSLYCQAVDMIRQAAANNVITRVAENFQRYPLDRFAQTLHRSGYIGPFRRIFSYNDHTGYHNNSRWITLADSPPRSVRCLTHDMEHPCCFSLPQRRHQIETYQSRFFHFDNLMVNDISSGHGKGLLGRQARPGYTEFQGPRGTFVVQMVGNKGIYDLRAEIRRVSDARLAPHQQATGQMEGGGDADQVTKVQIESVVGKHVRLFADTPDGRIEHRIPFCPNEAGDPEKPNAWASAVMDHLIDFALSVRGVRGGEFTEQHALQSQMMEMAARESARRDGEKINLPLDGDFEADQIERDRLHKQYGVDPMDVDAMLEIVCPRP